MTDTLANVDLLAGTWTDINTETGLAVGTEIYLQNLGGEVVKISLKTTGTPDDDSGFNKLRPVDDDNAWLQIAAGGPKVWAWSRITTQLNVQTGEALPPAGQLKSYDSELAKGNVTGSEIASILGSNTAASSTLQDIWDPGGTLTYPTSGEQWEIVSDNANDTSAGTGAQTVLLQYLDDQYIEQAEVLSTDGTSPVLTVATDMFRFRRALVLTAGSGDINEGTITVKVASAGATRGAIKPLNGNSLDGHFTVPAGKAAYLRFVYSNVVKGEDAEILLRSTVGTGKIFSVRFPLSMYQNTVVSPVELPARFSQKSDLKLTVTSTNPNTKVFAALQFEVVDEPNQAAQQGF